LLGSRQPEQPKSRNDRGQLDAGFIC